MQELNTGHTQQSWANLLVVNFPLDERGHGGEGDALQEGMVGELPGTRAHGGEVVVAARVPVKDGVETGVRGHKLAAHREGGIVWARR